MKRALHAKYGSVVRIGPTELIFVSAEAWKDIYGHRRGGKKSFIKVTKFYTKPINGTNNMITANDTDHTRIRKTLSHAFSDRALKEQQDLLAGYARKLVSKLSEAAASRTTVDLVKFWNCTTASMGSQVVHSGIRSKAILVRCHERSDIWGAFKLTRRRRLQSLGSSDIRERQAGNEITSARSCAFVEMAHNQGRRPKDDQRKGRYHFIPGSSMHIG